MALYVCTEYGTIPIDQKSEKAGIKLDRLSDYTCCLSYRSWILRFAEYFDSYRPRVMLPYHYLKPRCTEILEKNTFEPSVQSGICAKWFPQAIQ